MTPLFRIAAATALLVFSQSALAEIKAYDVSPEYRQEVFDVLSGILREDRDARAYPQLYGKVQMLPTGQVVVDASPERHQEIAALLSAMEQQSQGPTPSANLRYFVLHGSRDSRVADSAPSLLDGVISELEMVYGDLNFEMLLSANVASRSGSAGSYESEEWEIGQFVQINGDSMNASIGIENEFQEFGANVSLSRGEFLVLSDSTTKHFSSDGGVLAIIVHWPAN